MPEIWQLAMKGRRLSGVLDRQRKKPARRPVWLYVLAIRTVADLPGLHPAYRQEPLVRLAHVDGLRCLPRCCDADNPLMPQGPPAHRFLLKIYSSSSPSEWLTADSLQDFHYSFGFLLTAVETAAARPRSLSIAWHNPMKRKRIEKNGRAVRRRINQQITSRK